MFPMLAVPNAQMPPPILSDSFSGVPTQTSASQRIPHHAVPSTVSVEAIFNNRQGAASSLPIAARVANLILPAPQSQPHVQPGATIPGHTFTSTFMTQIIGQGGIANDNGIFASFLSASLPSSLTPSNELLERFSQTKYLPSDAFKPRPEPQGTARLMPEFPISRPVKIEVLPTAQPAATTQSAAAPQVASMAGIVPQTPSAPSAGRSVLRTSGNSERPSPATSNHIRFSDSLIRKRGVDAYIATFTRNLMNLDQDGNETPVSVEF